MSTPFTELFRRRRREPLDETLPDGRTVNDLLRGQLPGGAQGEQVLTPQNQQAIIRPRRTWAAPNTTATTTPEGVSPQGLRSRGNVEIYNRPVINNPDGSVSTTRSFSTGFDNGEVLMPKIVNGRELSEQDAINHYRNTGENLGVFDTSENADAYANALHNAQVAEMQRRGTLPSSSQAATPSATYSSSPDSQRQRAVTFNPATGRPNETFYRDRNDTAGLYNAYQNWQPHGAKRGFKNALKAGALTAAQAVAANPQDPVTAALAGFGIGAAGGAVKPNFKNRLVRGFKLQQTGAELGQQLNLQKQQASIDASQMVPVTLDNGQQVMVPAKTAATLASHQQEIGLRGDTLEARKKRWSQLSEHEAANEAQQLYNSGGADDSEELRAEIAKRLRLPPGTVLPPRTAGQIKLDKYGNYVLVNPRSGAVTDTGQSSFEPTKQKLTDQRQRRALSAAQQRVNTQQAGANQRVGMRSTGGVSADRVSVRKAAQLRGTIDAVRTKLERLDDQIARNPGNASLKAEREKIQTMGEQAAGELNALGTGFEAGPGEKGYPYYKQSAPKPTGKYKGQRISESNLPEAAKRLGMSVDDARKLLESEGATIYP